MDIWIYGCMYIYIYISTPISRDRYACTLILDLFIYILMYMFIHPSVHVSVLYTVSFITVYCHFKRTLSIYMLYVCIHRNLDELLYIHISEIIIYYLFVCVHVCFL